MWPNPQFPADLVAFTEEIFNVKLDFLCSVKRVKYCIQQLAINIFIPWYMSRLLITFFCLLLFFGGFFRVLIVNMSCKRNHGLRQRKFLHFDISSLCAGLVFSKTWSQT